MRRASRLFSKVFQQEPRISPALLEITETETPEEKTKNLIERVVAKLKRTTEEEEEQRINEFIKNIDANLARKAAPIVKGRRLSVAQVEFMRQVLKHRTPQGELRHQVEEKWTHLYLSAQLCFIAVSSGLVIFYGALTWAGELVRVPRVQPIAGPIFVVSGILMVASSLLGAYGAKRVARDISLDDDGLGTPGQKLLELYFHISFFFVVLITPVSLMELLSPGALVGEAQFERTGSYVFSASVSALIVVLLSLVSLRPTILIVTIYEMAQNFIEQFSLVLAILGVAGVAFTVSIMSYSRFLYTSSFSTSLSNTLYGFLVLSMSMICLSFVGFAGALSESRLLLRFFAMVLSVICFILSALLLSLLSISFSSLVENNCKEILKIMSRNWWQQSLGCDKYGGAEIGALVETFSNDKGFHYGVATVGEAVRCPSKDMAVYAWEFNTGRENLNSPQTNFRPTSYQGCLKTECCKALVTRLHSLR